MAVINKEIVVNVPPEKIWSTLIEDPNRWTEWLTPIRALEEKVTGAVREGLEFHIQMGKMGGAKVKVKEVVPNRLLRWNGGPPMAHIMGMAMRGTLEFRRTNGATHVSLRMVTPMMMAPMMGMMSGLKPREEMEKTIQQIKRLSEK